MSSVDDIRSDMSEESASSKSFHWNSSRWSSVRISSFLHDSFDLSMKTTRIRAAAAVLRCMRSTERQGGKERGGRISLWKIAHFLPSLSFFSTLAWLNIHREKKMRRTRCSLLIFSEHAKVFLLWFYCFSEQLYWHIDLIVQIRYSPLLLSLLKDFIACLSFFPTSAFSFPSPSSFLFS